MGSRAVLRVSAVYYTGGWPRHKDFVLQSQGKCCSSLPTRRNDSRPLHHKFLPQMVWLVHGLPSQNEGSRAAQAMPALTRENIKHCCGQLVNVIEWRNEPVPKRTLSVSAWIPLDDDTRLDLPSSNGQDQTSQSLPPIVWTRNTVIQVHEFYDFFNDFVSLVVWK